MIKSEVTSTRFVSPSLCLWKAYTIVCSAMFLILAQFLICIPPSGASSVTLFPTPNPTCTDGTITEKNTFASVVLTGTATSCARLRGGSYKCTLQVWRVMKGSNLVMDILKGDRNIKAALPSKTYAEVYGMGNSAYCDSTVSDHDTRIFFLTRTADRLVLAASLLHITLKHLENTQNVIDGIAITERAPKPKNPCLDIICGYGAKCSLVDDVAKCECPHQTCDNEIVSPVCGSNGVTYSNICRLRAAQCNTQRRIRVAKETMCDVEETSGDFDEVSGDNVCNCHFGATCDDTSDDEDKSCACNFNCSSTSANLGPVCGSDVQTYANKCELLRAQCVMQRRLYVIKNETCNHDVKPQDKCFCNEYGSYTSTCDAVTRQCPCKPGVGGTLCDRCVPGYWNFRALAEKLISGCMECHCHEHGSVRSDCDQMTGACQCKPGITTGLKCTDCINDNSWVTSSMCDTTELESSGCGIGDDDDCENDESGSGDKDNINSHHKELTTIAFISTTNELKEATARSIKTLIGTAKFFKHEGLDLIYTSDLGVPMSELFKEYSAIIDTLVMKAANQSSLRGRIYSVTPTSFAKAKWYWTTGVRVAFNLEVDAKLLPEEVQQNLNDAYDIDNQYEIESRYP